jgi:PBP1b-binding outer membrane lipoprotein LpoB
MKKLGLTLLALGLLFTSCRQENTLTKDQQDFPDTTATDTTAVDSVKADATTVDSTTTDSVTNK